MTPIDQATPFVPAPGSPLPTPLPHVPVVPAPADGALEAVELKLERALRLLEEQEERYRDLQEVVADLLPAVNGMLRSARDNLAELEASGVLHALPLAGRFVGRVRDPRGVKPLGVLGALRALRDPDVGRGVALLLEVLRAIGAAAKESDVHAAAAAAALVAQSNHGRSE